MKYRAKVSSKGSRRLFSKTAVKVNKINFVKPKRGGERL